MIITRNINQSLRNIYFFERFIHSFHMIWIECMIYVFIVLTNLYSSIEQNEKKKKITRRTKSLIRCLSCLQYLTIHDEFKLNALSHMVFGQNYLSFTINSHFINIRRRSHFFSLDWLLFRLSCDWNNLLFWFQFMFWISNNGNQFTERVNLIWYQNKIIWLIHVLLGLVCICYDSWKEKIFKFLPISELNWTGASNCLVQLLNTFKSCLRKRRIQEILIYLWNKICNLKIYAKL